jgi:hypothetical protein
MADGKQRLWQTVNSLHWMDPRLSIYCAKKVDLRAERGDKEG